MKRGLIVALLAGGAFLGGCAVNSTGDVYTLDSFEAARWSPFSDAGAVPGGTVGSVFPDSAYGLGGPP
jgi:hypothetical protein